MKRVRITKISDNAFEGNHPNGINEGYELTIPSINVGYCIIDSLKMDHFGSGFTTSPITCLPDENGIFKTLYSTYKLEYLD